MLRPTASDLHGQFMLDQGEYLGVRLADLGFTGDEDFSVSMTVVNIPQLHPLDWAVGPLCGSPQR